MAKVSLDDKFLIENCKAIIALRSLGLTDEQIQELYEKQVARDKKENKEHDRVTLPAI